MSNTHFRQGDEPGMGQAFPLLYNLVYCSKATAGVDDAAVARIIEIAKRYNPEQGITGLLVFGSGIFFQWLEGPRDNVTELMGKLKADPRHDNIVMFSENEEVRERLFPDWDMELVTTDDIRDVLVDARDSAEDAHNADALSMLLAELDSGRLSVLGAAAG
jgi:Sensors of blue-light using FAD